MKHFLRNKKGSVTVMVTMILLPTIFLNAFLVDMARYKLYTDQAVMAADNYAAAILSEYDGVLKELYGLYSISQEEQDYINGELKEYILCSFDPSGKPIRKPLFGNSDLDGFMPYSSIGADLQAEYVEESHLSDNDVLNSQISQYMQYEIVNVMLQEDNPIEGVVDAISQMEKQEENAELADKYNEFAKAAAKAYDAMEDYCAAINHRFANYENNTATYINAPCFVQLYDSIKSDPAYIAYINGDETADRAEVEKLFDPKLLKEVADAYNNLQDAIDEQEDAIKSESTKHHYRPADFNTYGDCLNELADKRDALIKALEKVEEERTEVNAQISTMDPEDDMVKEISSQLTKIDEVLATRDGINDLYDKIAGNLPLVEAQRDQYNDLRNKITNDKNAVLSNPGATLENPTPLSFDGYYRFNNDPTYTQLYNMVSLGNSDNKAAETRQEQAEKAEVDLDNIDDDTDVEPRDLPANLGLLDKTGNPDNVASTGTKKNENIFKKFVTYIKEANIKDLISDGVGLVSNKLYLTTYDCNMFTNRVTEVKNKDDDTTAHTLSGYKYDRDINYVYGAEQEYLVAGNYKSKDNLNSVRNRIVTFRMIMNYYNTYSIPKINNAINKVSDLAAANPLLAVALNQALRVAVASIESYEDWQRLMDGEKVLLSKSKLSELSAYDKIKALIPEIVEDSSAAGTEAKGIKLSYDNYLQIMMMFFTSQDNLAIRTGNLIMVNVNNVKQGSPEVLSNLDSFQIAEAYTAVDVSVTGETGFVIFGFDSSSINNEHKSLAADYSVVRGY